VKYRVQPWLLVIATLLSFSLSAQDHETLTEVMFAESEPGIADYPSRVLMNARYLRFDDGIDDGDYVLFDRDTREIHSFNHEDETHLRIVPSASEAPEFDLDFSVERRVLSDAPAVNGRQPVEHVYRANGQLCRKSVNVEGFLEELRLQLVAYEQTLVTQGLQTLERLPAALRTACYMANHYLYATSYLDAGFPMYVEDYTGTKKRLISFSQVEKPTSLMGFVEDYRVYYATEPEPEK
jgi:hypothetical protein